jgi:hypothetical protein
MVSLIHNYNQPGNEHLTDAMDLLICSEDGECKMKALMDSKGNDGS